MKVPRNLYDRLQQHVESKRAEFSTVEQYVTFVLETLLKEEQASRPYDPEEEERIRKRLRSLGYE